MGRIYLEITGDNLSITQIPGNQVLNGTITDDDVATANKDGSPSTPCMRTLGTGSQQAAAGNDSRFNFIDPGICHGRLTVVSGKPFPTTDRTSQGTLYFTPYIGNRISIYDGSNWISYALSEISLSLTVTSGNNYDVFIYDNSGTLTLELSAWTDDTHRATAIVLQDGVYVKNGATTRRYLGTIRASGTNIIEDSAQKRFLWNMYNRVPRKLHSHDTSVSWTYASTTWRQANASNVNQVEVVIGLEEGFVILSAETLCTASGVTGIGFDSTTTLFSACGITTGTVSISCHFVHSTPSGYHFYAQLERVDSGTVTFDGTAGNSTQYGFCTNLNGMSWG